MNRKHSITILATIVLLAAMMAQLFFAGVNVAALTYTPDYTTVGGVLASDSYVLFPYLKKNLIIGFSKYGELIDGSTKTGLNYNGLTDPFAPFAGVGEYQWVEGWVLNVTYNSAQGYKNVWALALHSDYYNQSSIGGPWIEGVTGGSDNLAYLGGRKTNGGAVTDPIEVLYDGPRRFVALLNTTIYSSPSHDIPLVKLTFTIIFDKDKKQVIILKDVKRVDYGKNYGDMQIEFGDRGEWDLGTGSPPLSYAHVFENQTTVYNSDYQDWYNTAIPNWNGTYDVCQIIDDQQQYVAYAAFWPKPISTWVQATQGAGNIQRSQILSTISTITEDQIGTGSKDSFTLSKGEPTPYPQRNATGVYWKEDPMVFVNGIQKVVNGTQAQYMVWYFADNNTVKFPQGYIPGVGDVVRMVYKVHNIERDMVTEPDSPFLIGEWAFRMSAPGEQFRGVTVYGVTDLNDGDDANIPGTGHTDVLDKEVKYYLNETFNPFDLYQAVEKKDFRWVNFFSGDGTTKNFTLTGYAGTQLYNQLWGAYNTEAEQVLVNGALQVPVRALNFTGTTYNYTSTLNGNNWNINFTAAPPTGTKNIKVLFSTSGTATPWWTGGQETAINGQYEWIVVGHSGTGPGIDAESAAYITEAFDSIKGIDVLKTGTDFKDTAFGPNAPYVMAGPGTGTRADYIDSLGRPSLRDDWCTTIPVASSNMIFVGGPTANLGTEYFNEFTNVFAPRGQYVLNDTGQSGKIMALTCWARNTYISNSTMGYGVISVHEDLNGTVGLLLWGYNGQDTYYVTNWFFGGWNWPAITTPDGSTVHSGIEYLQHENHGVTDIVLQIDYSSNPTHPTITIAHNERLGTISEKGQHDP